MKIENIGNFEEKSYTECPLYKKMTEGRYPWGSDEDKVLKYCANDVTIIAEQMAREKQKELEDKVEKYEKILCDILNETYEHPQLFEHNIHAYKLIPGHIRFLRNSFNIMCDKYDPVYEENAKLKEEIERLKGSNNDLKEAYNHLLKTFKKENESGSKIVEENVKLENEKTELIKASKRKDDLIRSLRNENKTRDDEIMRLQWRNDNQSRMIQDLKKERDEIDDKYGKLKFKFCDMLQEKGELEETNNRYYKDNERLAKKNRELQIRVNDLLFQEKLNKSAFGYDYEEENGKLRVENEQLRNMVKSQRNCSSSYYYSAMKAEDKIEHIQKEAKKWKRKYKEAYDILQELFGPGLINMEYEASYDDLILHLTYEAPAHGDKGVKCNKLREAYERMKKLD